VCTLGGFPLGCLAYHAFERFALGLRKGRCRALGGGALLRLGASHAATRSRFLSE
jgi:hypothetical protein